MGMLNQFLKEKGASLMAELTDAGFTEEEAMTFIPTGTWFALDGLCDQEGMMAGELSDPNAVERVLGRMDVHGLVSKSRMDPNLVEYGLRCLIPELLNVLGKNAHGIFQLFAALAPASERTGMMGHS